MSRERHHYRVTVPMFYPEGSPGHHYPSGRQGYYTEAETARTAAVKIMKQLMRDGMIEQSVEHHEPVRFDVQLWDRTKRTKVIAKVWLQECGKCQMLCEDVEERYSFGVYAGRMCKSCCGTYRDNCGIDSDQGDWRELVADGETYWEEDY